MARSLSRRGCDRHTAALPCSSGSRPVRPASLLTGKQASTAYVDPPVPPGPLHNAGSGSRDKVQVPSSIASDGCSLSRCAACARAVPHAMTDAEAKMCYTWKLNIVGGAIGIQAPRTVESTLCAQPATHGAERPRDPDRRSRIRNERGQSA